MPTDDLRRVVDTAAAAGLELDESEARRWLSALEGGGEDEITLDHRTGVFGHRVAMLDFSAKDLAYFKSVGAVVEIPDEEGVVETALALSGSAAQSKIQTHPGDCDYFERVNIIAASREEACRIAARVIRDKALSTLEGPTFRFMEAKFGQYPEDVLHGGEARQASSPIAWTVHEIEAGELSDVATPEGEPRSITWDSVADQPGWCKLDWVVADPVRKQVANASNMLDITWEGPGGSIVPLDGFLDPYFQEVYLETASVPLFSKLAQHVSADALDDYVGQLRKEVAKYVAGDHPNFGKAAKRMYNIFRLDGHYTEAAYIRELFDEPATALYQLYALVRAIEEASGDGSSMDTDTIVAQADKAILEVVRALEGVEEEELVERLIDVRNGITSPEGVDGAAVSEARDRLLNLVNNFFYEKLTAVPELRDYMGSFGG